MSNDYPAPLDHLARELRRIAKATGDEQLMDELGEIADQLDMHAHPIGVKYLQEGKT